jgi:hypothetical protein
MSVGDSEDIFYREIENTFYQIPGVVSIENTFYQIPGVAVLIREALRRVTQEER